MVCVTAYEKNFLDQIELEPCSAFVDLKRVQQVNPIGKIPVLILNDGTPLYDSTVICDYLDEMGEGARLNLGSGMDYWLARRARALADDMLTISVALTMENRRPQEHRSETFIARAHQQMSLTLVNMEEMTAQFKPNPCMVQIAFGCVLGYLDFRHAEIAWREKHLQLLAWFSQFSQRPSMLTTTPRNL
jgi:glutathione S-transferase